PAPPTPAIYTLSLHDALPICAVESLRRLRQARAGEREHLRRDVDAAHTPRAPLERRQQPARSHPRVEHVARPVARELEHGREPVDRKSTRLNSSHLVISYAVF